MKRICEKVEDLEELHDRVELCLRDDEDPVVLGGPHGCVESLPDAGGDPDVLESPPRCAEPLSEILMPQKML